MFWSGLIAFVTGFAVYHLAKMVAPDEVAIFLSMLPMWGWMALFYLDLIERLDKSRD